MTNWTTFRHGGLLDGERTEVFVSPSGDWYIRAGDEEPDIEIPSKTPGVPPIKLKCINHWKPVDPPMTP